MGFTYVRRGEMEYQQNLHVGLIRMKEYFTRNEQSSIHFGEAAGVYSGQSFSCHAGTGK